MDIRVLWSNVAKRAPGGGVGLREFPLELILLVDHQRYLRELLDAPEVDDMRVAQTDEEVLCHLAAVPRAAKQVDLFIFRGVVLRNPLREGPQGDQRRMLTIPEIPLAFFANINHKVFYYFFGSKHEIKNKIDTRRQQNILDNANIINEK